MSKTFRSISLIVWVVMVAPLMLAACAPSTDLSGASGQIVWPPAPAPSQSNGTSTLIMGAVVGIIVVGVIVFTRRGKSNKK